MWWLAIWLGIRALNAVDSSIVTAIYSVGCAVAIGLAIIINHLEEGVVVGVKKP